MNNENKKSTPVWYWNQPDNENSMEEYEAFFKEAIRQYHHKERIRRKMLLAI